MINHFVGFAHKRSSFKPLSAISQNGHTHSNKQFVGFCQRIFSVCLTILWGWRLKKILWRRCFPVNFAKFVRTPVLQNSYGQLFLYGPKLAFGTDKLLKLLRFKEVTCLKSWIPERRIVYLPSIKIDVLKGTVVRSCSVTKVFLENLQSSQENTYARDSF